MSDNPLMPESRVVYSADTDKPAIVDVSAGYHAHQAHTLKLMAHVAELEQQLSSMRASAVKAMIELQLRRKHLSAGWEHLPDVIQPPPPPSPAPIPLRALRTHRGVYGLQTLQDR